MALRLELNGIAKYYGGGNNRISALKEISFSVAEGEFLAVQGPSGSGKSSLLNICGLLDKPDAGQYRLNGKAVEELTADERCFHRRSDIGFIFQRHQLIPAMTVYENIAYPLFLNDVSSSQIKHRVAHILEKIGLNRRRDHLPNQLSGGECQRVGIARALIKQPQLVIADEPTANLDHKHAQVCLDLMRDLNEQQGASFIVASHDAFVVKHCDRALTLIDGRMEVCL